MTVNILGTTYTIKTADIAPEGASGLCDYYERTIRLVDFNNSPEWKDASEQARERVRRETLRHEIIHAFLYESGLGDSACLFEGAWCKNEEMIDWFAIQGTKLVEAWKEAGCL